MSPLTALAVPTVGITVCPSASLCSIQVLRTLQVKVIPNSKHQAIQDQPDGSFVVHLKSPPVEGKANQELIKLLAKQFGVPKSKVRITLGLSSRHKRVELLD